MATVAQSQEDVEGFRRENPVAGLYPAGKGAAAGLKHQSRLIPAMTKARA